MTAPSKLAVEIAEAVFTWTAETTPVSDEIAREEIATLIDAKIRPLVEDGALLDQFQLLRQDDVKARQISEDEVEAELVGHFWVTISAQTEDVREAIRQSVDQARAQRPAQEGSEKP